MGAGNTDDLILPVPPEPFGLIVGGAMRGQSADALATALRHMGLRPERVALDAADDIYKLDDTVTKKVTPPEPIAKYLNVYGWRLRDSNFSPDFASSMKTFEEIYASSTQKKKINGKSTKICTKCSKTKNKVKK